MMLPTKLFIAAGLMALTVSFQNCAQSNFSAGAGDAASNRLGGGYDPNDPLTADLLAVCNKTTFETITKKLRIVLIVDNSGSTLQTDPNKFRQASIQDLLSRYSGKANFSWQIILFNGTTARALINKNGNVNDPVFADAAAAQAALDVFKAEAGTGNTPYLAALRKAEDAIRLDPEFNSADAPVYVTMFMSDGQPTDSNDSQILEAEKTLLDRAPTRITLNSLYFGQDNKQTEIARLKSMSDLGKGQFTNITSQQAVIKIDDISVVPQSGCVK